MACVFYRDLWGAWRWEMRERDGSVMESPFGYASRAECVAAAVRCGLPVDESTVTAADDARDGRQASVLPRRSVLCVVSNPDARLFLQDVLAEYRVVVAPTGFEALKSLNHAVFDMYIVDYWLADWSGVALCRDIRKIDPRGPVCFYTTTHRAEHRLRAFNAGASLYIEAPVDRKLLSQQLRTLVDSADAESLRARLECERVIQAELDKRAPAMSGSPGDVIDRAVAAIERAAKVKAYPAFADAGGTRAHFERWWPQLFASAWASWCTATQPKDS